MVSSNVYMHENLQIMCMIAQRERDICSTISTFLRGMDGNLRYIVIGRD